MDPLQNLDDWLSVLAVLGTYEEEQRDEVNVDKIDVWAAMRERRVVGMLGLPCEDIVHVESQDAAEVEQKKQERRADWMGQAGVEDEKAMVEAMNKVGGSDEIEGGTGGDHGGDCRPPKRAKSADGDVPDRPLRPAVSSTSSSSEVGVLFAAPPGWTASIVQRPEMQLHNKILVFEKPETSDVGVQTD